MHPMAGCFLCRSHVDDGGSGAWPHRPESVFSCFALVDSLSVVLGSGVAGYLDQALAHGPGGDRGP
jgi:hypothetical protein